MIRLTEFFHRRLPDITAFGMKVLMALVFFALGRLVIKWVRKLVRESLKRTKADKGVEQFMDSFLKFGLYTLLILGIVSSLEPLRFQKKSRREICCGKDNRE